VTLSVLLLLTYEEMRERHIRRKTYLSYFSYENFGWFTWKDVVTFSWL